MSTNTNTAIYTTMFILCLYYVYIYIYNIYIWGLSNGGYPKLWYPKPALTPRFREPFAPFHAPAESGHWIVIRFLCAISSQRFTGGLYLKHSFGHLTSGHWFCTHALIFFKVATLQKELAHFGPGLGPGGFTFREPFADLSRTFRGPFANLSRTSRLKNNISETNVVYARVCSTNLCQTICAHANRARKNAKYEYDNLCIKIVVFRPFASLTPRLRGLSPLED